MENLFTYEDSFKSSTNDIWYTQATFDGNLYHVIAFGEDGFIRLYKNHPLAQNNIPTRMMRWKLINVV